MQICSLIWKSYRHIFSNKNSIYVNYGNYASRTSRSISCYYTYSFMDMFYSNSLWKINVCASQSLTRTPFIATLAAASLTSKLIFNFIHNNHKCFLNCMNMLLWAWEIAILNLILKLIPKKQISINRQSCSIKYFVFSFLFFYEALSKVLA